MSLRYPLFLCHNDFIMEIDTITVENLPVEVARLKDEVRHLRSLLIGFAWEDEEGEYNPQFVKEILEAAEETPVYEFKDKKTLLQQIKDL